MSPQQQHALSIANAVRTAKAVIREEVRTGERSLFDLIIDPPDAMVSTTIVKLLAWQPRVGPIKARALLRNMPEIPDMNIELRNLGPVRRQALIDRMRSGVNGVPPITA